MCWFIISFGFGKSEQNFFCKPNLENKEKHLVEIRWKQKKKSWLWCVQKQKKIFKLSDIKCINLLIEWKACIEKKLKVTVQSTCSSGAFIQSTITFFLLGRYRWKKILIRQKHLLCLFCRIFLNLSLSHKFSRDFL